TPRLKFWAEEAGEDALASHAAGRTADGVCDSSKQREGRAFGVVPGVRDFASHRISVATTLQELRDADGVKRAQPPAAPQSFTDGSLEATARGDPAPANRLGREKVARAAGRRRDRSVGAHDSPHSGAERFVERGCTRAGAWPFRAQRAERTLADGQQGKVSAGRWGMSPAVDSGRSQPLCRGTLRAAGIGWRASARLFSRDVSSVWAAAGHADGSRVDVVDSFQRLGPDAAFRALDRTRNSSVVWTRVSSADAGESGAVPSHAGCGAAAPRRASPVCRLAGGAGRSAVELQRTTPARSAGSAAPGAALSVEPAELCREGKAMGVSERQ